MTPESGRVLGIGGSPRRNGNSDRLLQEVLAGAEEAGAACRAVYLRDVLFSSCIGCERCRKDKACTGLTDGMTVLYPAIEAARGLVLASPAHHYNVSALMKAFIDRLYCYYDFTDDRPRGHSSRLAGQGRRAVVAGVCEQEDPADMGVTVQMQRKPLEVLGYEVLGEVAALGVFDAGRVRGQVETMRRARELGQALGATFRE
jgi:multimeric flavodoxin WrbA